MLGECVSAHLTGVRTYPETLYNKESLVASQQTYLIMGGDSKEKLLAQLFDIGRVKDRPPFNVKLVLDSFIDVLDVQLSIIGLKAEDGSGDNWVIYGYSSVPGLEYFEGYYNTRTRNGWLKYGSGTGV